MLRLRHVLFAFVATALVLGTAFAAGVDVDASAFDPYESDEGYVDLVLEDDVLIFTFDETEGAIPGSMEGDALPLDEDFEEELLHGVAGLALYGGLPVGMTPNTVILELDGEGPAIRDAILARLDELGLEYGECFAGGPICSFDVTHGESHWLLSITPRGTHAMVYLQATR
jgi:hypothetical protein